MQSGRTGQRDGGAAMQSGNRLAGADGVRGLACLIVLGVHTSAIVYPQTYPYLAGCGKIGVWLFFVLSAFLLTHQLAKRGLSAATLSDYAAGRVLRILPAFTVAVLLYWAVGTADIDSWRDVIQALTLRQAYAHLWTIPVEFKTYAAIPIAAAILIAIKNRYGSRFVVAAAAIATAAHQLFFPYTALVENSIEAAWYFPSFLIGCAAALCVDDWQRGLNARTNRWLALGAITLVIVMTPAFRSFAFGSAPDRFLMNKYLFLSLIWIVFILAVVSSSGALHQIFNSRIMTSLGACSYSTYLIHWYIVMKLSTIWPARIETAAAAVLLSIVGGAIGYLCIEKPCERLRREFRDRILVRPRLAATHG